MSRFPQGRWVLLCVLFLIVSGIGALHAATPEDEYRKLIHINEDIQPLGEHPFGENISLYDGSLSFTQTDISLPGNGPLLQLVRQFNVQGDRPATPLVENVFVDWELAIPHLETFTAGSPDAPMRYYNSYTQHYQSVDGWQIDTMQSDVDHYADVNTRCNDFTVPPTVFWRVGTTAYTDWSPSEWWKGYHLVLPGKGSQDILKNTDVATKGTYPAVTKDHWRFSCLPSTANGQPGEGFLGQAPDGTQYWFDELIYRGAPGMTRRLYDDPTASVEGGKDSRTAAVNKAIETLISLLSGSGVAHAEGTTDNMVRRLGVLLVTKVQDRFGNTLVYKYDDLGDLTDIIASDGRSLHVSYAADIHRVESVTLQPSSGSPRTWRYAYSSDNLSLVSVTLPDQSQWKYSLRNFYAASLRSSTTGTSCLKLAAPFSLSAVSGTITHPSGLTGTFTVQPIKHSRSYVRLACAAYQYNDYNTPGSYVVIPYAWYAFTATNETISGAGVPTRTWSYDYSPAPDTWINCFANGCATTVYTDVHNPDASTTRYTFSNRSDSTESQLLRTDYYAGAVGSALVRSEVNGYASPAMAPLPVAGTNLQGTMVNVDQTTKYSPLNKRVITEEGTSYTWQAEAFNSYAQVTRTNRQGAGQAAIEEQTDYLNDTIHWVLGLPTRVTNVTKLPTGVVMNEVMDQNIYNTSNDTLAERWHFGQELMSYTFNAQGQLASFKDGNSHATTLGNYKRGIPQSIGYPDGTHQSLVVDDFGQIQAITDQAGATTSYAYDAVGRLTRITYPTGDEQAWYPKTFSYAYVTGAERGVSANHWRRTIAKGNQRQVTYFNAELQPVLTDTYINGDANSHINVLRDYNEKGLATFNSYPVPGSPNFGAITDGTHNTYDVLGRLTRTQLTSKLGTLTTSTAYLSGARRQVTDPRGKVTTTSYQVFDEPSYGAVLKVQAPTGLTQTIVRDLYGNPLSITQAGLYGTGTISLTKTLAYDSYHRLCRTTEPESGSEVMAYDGANNLDWSAAGLSLTGSGCGLEQVAIAGRTVRRYDTMNRLYQLDPPSDTQGTTYAYDALGNLKSAVSGISTWSATRNKLGQLTGETLQLGTQSAWRMGYAHDAYGSLKSLTYPDGTVVAYAPDALGRATQVGAFASGIDYFPNGEVASFSYGNGATYLAEQNAWQRLINFSYGRGSALNLSEDYSYDANGNITQQTDLVDGRRTKAFGYDDLNRLTSATASHLWGTESYTYDPLNNIKSRVGNGATFTYNYDGSNRLASITGAASSSFAYDNRGNVVRRNGSTLQFDQKNQLTQITGLASYSYDAAGRRVEKIAANGSPTYYFYSQAGQLLYQWEPATVTATNFVYLGRKLVARDVSRITHVIGNIEGVSIDSASNATVNGWACSTGMNQSIGVEVFAGGASGTGGTRVATATANRASEPAVATACHASGTAYRFAVPLSATVRQQYQGKALYMYGDSPVGNGNLVLSRSGTYQVPAPSVGGAPTLTVPASNGTGSYTVDWNGIANATSYTLQEQLNGGSWATIQTGAAVSRPISGKANGRYGYRVQACNSVGCGAWSATATTVVLHPPSSAPTVSVPASSASGSYTASWTAVSTATSYTLQEQLNGGSWVTVQASSATSRAISGKGNGTYGYRAQACNGGGCGPWSATDAIVVTHPPASAPTVSVPTSSTTGSYTASWTAVSTATSYTLQEQVNGGGWTTLQSSGATSRAISGKGGGTYGYHVRACNVGGCSGWSATDSISVLRIPAAPAGLSATIYATYESDTRPPRTFYSLSASWSASATATKYDFQYCTGGVCAVLSTTSTSAGVDPIHGTSYTVNVRACNATGCSAWSPTVTPSVVNQ